MTRRHAAITALILAGALGCRPPDQRTDEFDTSGGAQARENMPAAAVIQLDSGSTAFRNEDFETALDHYTRFTELAPEFGAGWFGVYMSHRELGNEDAAAAALERARGVVPGATLLHSEVGDTLQ